VTAAASTSDDHVTARGSPAVLWTLAMVAAAHVLYLGLPGRRLAGRHPETPSRDGPGARLIVPGNVMVHSDAWFLVDFGVSALLGSAPDLSELVARDLEGLSAIAVTFRPGS
jgi:hypothetical protein